MKNLSQLLVLPVALVAGCASDSYYRIDDALLSELSPSSMSSVAEARATKDTAADALAKAERDTRWAEEQVDLVRSNLKVTRSQLEEAKLAKAVVERSGTISQTNQAQLELDFALANSDAGRSLLALKKRELEHAKLAQNLALEELRFTTAQVELEKATAVQELDRVAAQRIAVKDYQKQVRYHETEVEVARVRLSAMAANVEDARQEYAVARAAADELRSAR